MYFAERWTNRYLQPSNCAISRQWLKYRAGNTGILVSPIYNVCLLVSDEHDDVIKWKHFPRYWPFVRGIHRSPVNSPHKGQWRGALILSLICVWINSWVNNRKAGDLRRNRVHCDVSVMVSDGYPILHSTPGFIFHRQTISKISSVNMIFPCQCYFVLCWVQARWYRKIFGVQIHFISIN